MAHKTPSTWRALATIALCIPLTLTLATPSAALAEKLVPSAPEASALEDEAPQAETASEELPAEKDTASPEATPETSEPTAPEAAAVLEGENTTPEPEAAAPAPEILATSEASAVAAAPAPKTTNAVAAQPAATTPVAQIGDATYTDLPSAIKAAKPGETITLLANVDMSNTGVHQLPDGSTLDLSGFTISSTNFTSVYEGNSITIKNGTFDSKGGSYGLFVGNDAGASQNVVLQDLKIHGGINIFNAGIVTLRNADVDARVSNPYYAVWCDADAQVIIESGHYTSSGAAVLGLVEPQQGIPASSLEVRGGTFDSSSAQALVLPGANRYPPVITGGTFSDPSQATPYIAQNHTVLDNDGKTGTVVPVTADETNISPTPIDPSKEIIATPITPEQSRQVEAALAQSHIQEAIEKQLQENGVTENKTWTVNIVARDKQTKVEDHDNAYDIRIPYPSDFDKANYSSYDYRVFHVAQVKQGDGSYVSDYQIVDPSKIEITPDGIKIYSTTLSPFIVSYVKKAAPAPHNQDSQDQKGQQENTQQTNTSKKSTPTQVTQTTPKQATHETPKLGDDDGLWPVFFALAMLVTFGIVDLAWRYRRQ